MSGSFVMNDFRDALYSLSTPTKAKTRDAQALTDELRAALSAGLRPSESDPISDVETLRSRAPQLLTQILDGLRANALLAS